MLASELRDMEMYEVQSLSHAVASELVRRVEEAEDSKAEVTKAYDKLAEVDDIWQAQVKVLKETCEKAVETLSYYRGSGKACDDALLALKDGLERAKALEEE